MTPSGRSRARGAGRGPFAARLARATSGAPVTVTIRPTRSAARRKRPWRWCPHAVNVERRAAAVADRVPGRPHRAPGAGRGCYALRVPEHETARADPQGHPGSASQPQDRRGVRLLGTPVREVLPPAPSLRARRGRHRVLPLRARERRARVAVAVGLPSNARLRTPADRKASPPITSTRPWSSAPCAKRWAAPASGSAARAVGVARAVSAVRAGTAVRAAPAAPAEPLRARRQNVARVEWADGRRSPYLPSTSLPTHAYGPIVAPAWRRSGDLLCPGADLAYARREWIGPVSTRS